MNVLNICTKKMLSNVPRDVKDDLIISTKSGRLKC